ncbi:MAG: hypothetical protein EON54_06335 [Alcaligenaceae bacterium]|nr:MAG: hypothetical protein EON54_06335 [Alcaligenaceae bacterium]
MITAPTLADVPAEILDRLNGVWPALITQSREGLDQSDIILSHDQLAQFQKGIPVLLMADRVEHRDALRKGRREKKGIERRVQDAHAIQTYVGLERIREWIKARRTAKLTVMEQRSRAMELLAEEAWLDDPNTKKATNDEDRLKFFRTQFDAGSRLIATWYPSAAHPDDLSRIAREIVKKSSEGMKRSEIEDAIDHELAMNRSMLRFLRQATTLVLTEHAMSDEIRKNDRETKYQRAILSGAHSDHPALHQAVRAALDGDFNPSDLFRSLLSYRDTLELARWIGRRGRGHDERLDQTLAREMKRQIRLRAERDDAMKHAESSIYGEHDAALVITKAAYQLFRPETWTRLLDQAIAADKAGI